MTVYLGIFKGKKIFPVELFERVREGRFISSIVKSSYSVILPFQSLAVFFDYFNLYLLYSPLQQHVMVGLISLSKIVRIKWSYLHHGRIRIISKILH